MVDQLYRCRRWIEAALEHTDKHTFWDVAEAVAEGRMQLWPGERGCLITEIQVYPRRRVLNVFLAAGEFAEMLEMDPAMTEWAKRQGCEEVTASGRMGWMRRLKAHGWETDCVFMKRAL